MTSITWEQLQSFTNYLHNILEDEGRTKEFVHAKALLETLGIKTVMAPKPLDIYVINDAYIDGI